MTSSIMEVLTMLRTSKFANNLQLPNCPIFFSSPITWQSDHGQII